MSHFDWSTYVSHGKCEHCGESFDWSMSHKHMPHKKTGQPRCLRKRPDRSKHQALVARACAWLSGGKQRCRVVFAEPTMSITHSVDAIGWRCSGGNGACSEVVECKTSISDLRLELNKSHRRCSRSVGNHRWFLVPEEIADQASKIIESTVGFHGWGLLVACRRKILVRSQALYENLTADSADDERYLLIQAVRRHELGVRWDGRTRRFEPFISLKRRKGGVRDGVA